MQLVKVQASNLLPGMFIAELDRPWLDTPFSLQGFVVRNEDEVDYITQYVDFVYVDVDYTGSKIFLPLMSKKPSNASTSNGLKIKADFQQAKISFESASESLDRVFNAIKNGKHADINTVKKSIKPLIDGVFRNKEAVAALTRMRKSSEYRYNHGIAMAVWSAILGRHIGLHRDELEKLAVGCAMCDVGMAELPEDLIKQTDELTKEQRERINQHTITGSKMISDNGDADIEILAIVENHHERYDGSGYPRRIEGAMIPLLARIAGLVDTYDAMINEHPHAQARSSYEAVQELLDSKGIHFQEALVEQFVQAIGLFPNGSLVELNTGEVAIVVRQNDMRRLKPEIILVLDSEKDRRSPLELLDLNTTGLVDSNARWIVRELSPNSYGVNNEEFFI